MAAALEPRWRGAARSGYAGHRPGVVRGRALGARRGEQSTTRRAATAPSRFQDIEGWKGIAAAGIAPLPFFAGFVLPVPRPSASQRRTLDGALASGSWRRPATVCCSPPRGRRRGRPRAHARLCAPRRRERLHAPGGAPRGLGYALPGTVLAIGILIPLAGFDNRVDAFCAQRFGVSTGLLCRGHVAPDACLCRTLSGRRTRRHRCRSRARVAQSRCRRTHARRDGAAGPVARALSAAAAGARRGRRCSSSSMP